MKKQHKIFTLLLIFCFSFFSLSAQTYTITTIAGNGTNTYKGDSGLATACSFVDPGFVTVDKKGNIYISDQAASVIRRIDKATGIIYTIAGTGVSGYNGDHIAADTALLYGPYGIKFGISGEDTNALFFCDNVNYRVRSINSVTGIISTVCGSGIQGYSGDGGPAILAKLSSPGAVCGDKYRNLFITDVGNEVIRKIDAVTNSISTYAGTGTPGYSGDSGAATAATLYGPTGITLDTAGNIFITDGGNNVIRRIDAKTAVITTVAGNGTQGYKGDSGLATAAELNYPGILRVDKYGSIYFTDAFNFVVRKVDGKTGIITTIAGTGKRGYSGDGGLATSAELNFLSGLTFGDSGTIYFSDYGNHRIRKLTPIPGTGVTNIREPKITASIYPNPAQNYLVIKNAEQQTYLLTDITGRVLRQGIASTQEQVLDIAALQASMYILQLADKQGAKTNLRFIKQ